MLNCILNSKSIKELSYGKKTNTGIPGLSFSWKRALGISQAKRNFTKTTGVPTTKSGIERRIGSTIIKIIFGKK